MIRQEQEYTIVGHHTPLDFNSLCESSANENMFELNRQKILGHIYGKAMVRLMAKDTIIPEAVSYAGITGFETRDGSKLAVVGGILTLPEQRGKGHSLATVEALCDLVLGDDAMNLHGHVGLVAKCNEGSQSVTNKLGFTHIGFEMGKAIMLRLA